MDFNALISKVFMHREQQLPVAAFRKPNDDFFEAFLQPDPTLYKTTTFEEPGFVFAPFDLNEDAVLIKGTYLRVNMSPLHWKPTNKRKDNIQHFYQPDDNEMKAYLEKIEHVKSKIQEGFFKKVVLSREEFVPYDPIQTLEIFKGLLSAYPNAFVYIFSHPKVGTWMGATPENLLSVRGNRIRTISLAGTKQYQSHQVISWREKEMAEQQIVTDYLLELLEPEADDIEVNGPETIRAGNLLHLHTEVIATLKDYTTALLIQKLHPTPAICGFPKAAAKTFLDLIEGYSRDYYAGFLGPVRAAKDADFFVNLRCMQMQEDKVRIFVGGGITSDSLAEDEWRETMAKSETMKRILFKIADFK
ncbi:MAG: chorismate-binding protein [Bacteroidetes bacterium]|nr:chorismate-binding protein [Bacteroidota bacterium]